MKIVSIVACSVLFLSLTACQNMKGRDVGTLVGAGAGAALGSTIGHGAGSALGAAGGAVAGGLIGHAVGKSAEGKTY